MSYYATLSKNSEIDPYRESKALARRITQFLHKYAYIDQTSSESNVQYTGKGAQQLSKAALILSEGRLLKSSPRSVWGVGYGPVGTDRGKMEHDAIIRELRGWVHEATP